eukprot:SAG22_NODE_39_length_26283_cov_18.486653_6_plen_206_part_00
MIGGGYQYRLAKKDGPLTEVEFQKTPLAFVGSQALRWGGERGERENITGTYLTEGVLPKGSTWAMDPIPCDMACPGCPGWTFEPRCKETPNCGNWFGGKGANNTDQNHCRCTGGTVYNVEIVDQVMIPKDLAPGQYVLGWRWDCGKSAAQRACAWSSPLLCAAPLKCAKVRLRILNPFPVLPPCCGAAEESNQVWSSCSDVTIKA